jgi:NADH-quinone oxidoreductase subunit N
MSQFNLAASLPLTIVAATAVILMLMAAMKRSHSMSFGVSLTGLAGSFASLWLTWQAPSLAVSGLLQIDSFSRLYMGVLLVVTLAILPFVYTYLNREREHKEEFYILVMLSTLGAMVLVASSHFASFFLGLEILSISLYALVAYLRSGRLPLEAGIKYLVLASSSAAFMLFGIALLYEESGFLDFARMAGIFAQPQLSTHFAVLWTGMALVLIGVGFKLALVPFHLWTPDVYEGAPLPVTALIATVSKASVFGFLLRWVHPFLVPGNPIWIVLALSAVASMLTGNLLALLQNNVKRILAYSSIAHMGYFFVALLAGGSLGLQAATYYLIAYLITIAGTFGVLTVLSSQGGECCEIEEYRGLFWRQPVLAGVFTTMLMSLAGIPLTAGFLGKFYVIAAGASSSIWTLVLILIVSSVIGLFYYLRIVAALFSAPSKGVTFEQATPAFPGGLSLAALVALLLFFGVYPSLLWAAIGSAIRSLG